MKWDGWVVCHAGVFELHWCSDVLVAKNLCKWPWGCAPQAWGQVAGPSPRGQLRQESAACLGSCTASSSAHEHLSHFARWFLSLYTSSPPFLPISLVLEHSYLFWLFFTAAERNVSVHHQNPRSWSVFVLLSAGPCWCPGRSRTGRGGEGRRGINNVLYSLSCTFAFPYPLA